MVVKGETLANGAPNTCPECGKAVKLQVCHSNAGYYIGTYCDCGPYSRESIYYSTREIAQHLLSTGQYERRC